MRTLLILRGAPGAGKSTWIKNNHLEDWTISPDHIRTLCSSKELRPNGEFIIAQNQDTECETWKILFELLEYRMSRGEFTIIDATASKTKDIKQYKDLAEKYRYRMFCVDFTDVPLEVCLKQNKLRPSYKWVPDEAIKNIYARFASQQVPGGVTIIKPSDFEILLEKPFDLSEYKKIVFVGDIHGCYDTLMQYSDFKNGLDPNTAYIFCGDFVDRGNQNAEVLHFLHSIMHLPNVCLLEGNHEKWIRDYGNEEIVKSKVFEYKTKPQLVEGGFTSKMARNLYRKIRQFSHFTYNGIEVLACHAGIPTLETNLLFLPTISLINGTGTYEDFITIAETWQSRTKQNQYLVHGHRNIDADEIRISDRVFNLEGRVEFGGELRIVELNSDLTWNEVRLADCQPVNKDLNTENRDIKDVETAITYLRNNKFVIEKGLGDDISSFNFSREAFMSRNWNKQTILARGLFLDTANNKIIARSYEKFFRVDENPDNSLAALRSKLQFPVSAYVKENGYLGIVSYDYNKDALFISSKSTNQGPYCNWFKEQIKPYYYEILQELRTRYLEDNVGISLVFECVDIKNDPHIVEYKENKIVLLDAIKNILDYQALSYQELQEIALKINCNIKKEAFVLNTWEEFKDLYLKTQDEVNYYKYNDEYIEGFVFKDSNGYMVKSKTAWYSLWKKLRGVSEQVLRCGYILRTGMLTSATENYFYSYCKTLYNDYYNKDTRSYPFKTDIISLRNMFENKY